MFVPPEDRDDGEPYGLQVNGLDFLDEPTAWAVLGLVLGVVLAAYGIANLFGHPIHF